MGKGVKHYFRNGKEHKGSTHKMPNGELHSNKTQTKTCPKRCQTPKSKTLSVT